MRIRNENENGIQKKQLEGGKESIEADQRRTEKIQTVTSPGEPTKDERETRFDQQAEQVVAVNVVGRASGENTTTSLDLQGLFISSLPISDEIEVKFSIKVQRKSSEQCNDGQNVSIEDRVHKAESVEAGAKRNDHLKEQPVAVEEVMCSYCQKCGSKRLRANADPLSSDTAEVLMVTPCELRKHRQPNDYWIFADGTAYDVSSYIHLHPGGELCIIGRSEGMVDAFEDLRFHSTTSKTIWESLKCAQVIGCNGSKINTRTAFRNKWSSFDRRQNRK